MEHTHDTPERSPASPLTPPPFGSGSTTAVAEADFEDRLALAAEVLTEDFDLDAARTRLDRVVAEQRRSARTVLWIAPAMLLGIFLLGPRLLAWAGVATTGGGRWLAAGSVALCVAVSVGWWWWSRRRVARALAVGPPAVRRIEDDLGRERRNGHVLITACGLIAGPTFLIIAWTYWDDGAAWWWTLWMLLLGIWFTIRSVRDGLRLVRGDRAERAERAERARRGTARRGTGERRTEERGTERRESQR